MTLFRTFPLARSLALILALGSTLLAGCSSVRSELGLATKAELNIQVADNVNPDDQGHASPIVLDVLVLKNRRQFEQEDFLSLYRDAAGQLGDDLINKVQLKEFIPGEKRTETLKLDDKARYIGILAEYSRYDKAVTKLLLPIEPHSTNDFDIEVGHLGLHSKE
ncbi:type VI secretion system lipoprotein TssJ [Mangrovitalea sediminis]|uniref:type VI secretion system lipoprotein TssJ n=1 Tax=Mangrovitalea sediminis TaxID=1982043 RepID=UPI0013046A5E|nr:type VI secretion system lipoprotein TssJ [Mangrovitalea sediminis]